MSCVSCFDRFKNFQLRRVAARHRRGLARRRRRHAAFRARPQYDSAEADVVSGTLVRELQEFLDDLDATKREVFVLAELEQLTAPEIAAHVGVGANTVYSRLRAARAKFEGRFGPLPRQRDALRSAHLGEAPSQTQRHRVWLGLVGLPWGATTGPEAATGTPNLVVVSAVVATALVIALGLVGLTSVTSGRAADPSVAGRRPPTAAPLPSILLAPARPEVRPVVVATEPPPEPEPGSAVARDPESPVDVRAASPRRSRRSAALPDAEPTPAPERSPEPVSKRTAPEPDALEPDALEPDALEPDALEPDAPEPDAPRRAADPTPAKRSTAPRPSPPRPTAVAPEKTRAPTTASDEGRAHRRRAATVPSEPEPADRLELQELRLLTAAQRDLDAARPRRALTKLRAHARRYPQSSLTAEREASIARAHCLSGRPAAARPALLRLRRLGRASLATTIENDCR
ncbi:MAG: sigma factor-like helix-turn-helix DNA-binding protein [Myxococcota bacterium]